MVDWSESLAAETDLLRIDFLVTRKNKSNNNLDNESESNSSENDNINKKDDNDSHENDNINKKDDNDSHENDNINKKDLNGGDDNFCVASEMCTFLWPESRFFGNAYEMMEQLLLEYHNVPMEGGEGS